eukprot:scaffold1222_cov260-Chaetoceros_neogracile.AAC.50
MLETTIIIDGRDHLLGRLASVVAKELLAGQKVVIAQFQTRQLWNEQTGTEKICRKERKSEKLASMSSRQARCDQKAATM